MLMRQPNEPFWNVNIGGMPPTGSWSRPAPVPADVYQDGDELVAVFDLPGIEPDAIEIHTHGNMVTVSAERRPPDIDGRAVLQQSERPLGVFSRHIECGQPLDTADVSAQYHRGVLVLRIAPAGHPRAARITVAATEAEPTVVPVHA